MTLINLHECECRYWLQRGYTTQNRVDELIARIAKHRGLVSAEKLRDGMRSEWLKRKGAKA